MYTFPVSGEIVAIAFQLQTVTDAIDIFRVDRHDAISCWQMLSLSSETQNFYVSGGRPLTTIAWLVICFRGLIICVRWVKPLYRNTSLIRKPPLDLPAFLVDN